MKNIIIRSAFKLRIDIVMSTYRFFTTEIGSIGSKQKKTKIIEALNYKSYKCLDMNVEIYFVCIKNKFKYVADQILFNLDFGVQGQYVQETFHKYLSSIYCLATHLVIHVDHFYSLCLHRKIRQ